MTDLIEVRISVPTQQAGAQLARLLVEERLAACVQALAPMTSTYRWSEGVESQSEVLLLAKTSRDRFEALAAVVRDQHSYDTPEILAVPVSAADEPYAEWVRESILPPAASVPIPVGERPASPVADDTPLPPLSPTAQGARAQLEGIVPVLPVSDLTRATENYQRLGFTVAGNRSESDSRYAFAQRGDAWLHLAPVEEIDAPRSLVAAFVYVDDAHLLYAEWAASGAEGRFVEPEATAYGMLEGAYIDVDGNLLRFGSPVIM